MCQAQGVFIPLPFIIVLFSWIIFLSMCLCVCVIYWPIVLGTFLANWFMLYLIWHNNYVVDIVIFSFYK